MNNRSTIGISAFSGLLLFGGSAFADLINVTMDDVSGGVGAPPGVTTWRVTAHFDNPTDSVLAIYSAPGIPLEFSTNDDQGLINAGGPFAGQKAEDFPTFPFSFAYDSWVAVGSIDFTNSDADYTPGFLDNDGQTAVIFGTDWAESDPYEGWFDIDPATAESGPDVVIAQFSIRSGFSLQLSGTVVWREDGVPGFRTTEFAAGFETPADFGACCFTPTECDFTTQENCIGLGGIFLGAGVPCSTQVAMAPCHPGDSAQHCVLPILDCPEGGGSPGGDGCIPGPLLDAWQTANEGGGDSSFHDFGGPGQAIPADFFGPGSDPFTEQVGLVGEPLGPIDFGEFGVHSFGGADTLIQRSADPFDRCDVPSAAEETVSVEIVELKLRSVDPIVVTFNGGQDPEEWNVFVDLSTIPPAPGSLTAIKTHCNGGTYSIDALRVQPRFTFINVIDPFQQAVLDTGIEGINPITLTLPDTPWVSEVDEALAVGSPFCTDFHPGIEQPDPTLDCDCNTNGVQDRCDVEDGTSPDCNENGNPDECDTSCAADVDGSICVDFQDLLLLLATWSPDPNSCVGCPADVDGDNDIDFQDLLLLLANWGPCP